MTKKVFGNIGKMSQILLLRIQDTKLTSRLSNGVHEIN